MAVSSLFLAILLAITYQVKMDQITGSVSCDNDLKFYVDGQLLASSNDWTVSSQVTFPDTAFVLAFKCVKGTTGGIIGKFSNGKRTNAEWKCSRRFKRRWLRWNFDDSSWQDATVITHPGSASNQPTDLSSSDDKWIWTDDLTDTTVYCRLRLQPENCVLNDRRLIVDVDNCKGYKQCVHQLWTSRPCADGTGFVERKQTCDHLFNIPGCN